MNPQVTFGRFCFAMFSMAMQVLSVYFLFKGEVTEFLLATITFGDTAAPNDIAQYFDALFTQSLPNARKSLTDNIGADNAILDKLMKSDSYESWDGGTRIEEPLLYGLTTSDWYDGYDELPDTPTDGVTDAIYEIRQMATPVMYSMKEIIQNRRRIVNMVTTKMTQANMGTSETFARALVNGSGESALRTPVTGSAGAIGIQPIAKIIDVDPTQSRSVGGINQSTSSWWRNRIKASSGSTCTALLYECNELFNTCSLGTGGSPDIFLTDQYVFESINIALHVKYRQTTSDPQFKFNNIRLPFGNGQCIMVMDEKMHDIENQLTPAVVGGSGLTTSSGYFVNTKFLKLRYLPERDFDMLLDENGKAFAKPLKGDSRLGHIAWMGELTVNNRRKHGVIYSIARNLTQS